MKIHRIESALGERSLSHFARLAWDHTPEATRHYKKNWHIDFIANHLEAVTRGEIKKLIINVPPGSMKSWLTCVYWPCWSWIQDPQLSWIFASYAPALSMRDANRTRALTRTKWFKDRWGDKLSIMDDKSNTNKKSEYYTSKGGMRFSTSVGGEVTGRHGDISIVDDPTKPPLDGNIVTSLDLQNTLSWWRGRMSSRKANPETHREVIIMQRIHSVDLSGLMLEEEKGWVHLCLPMEYEPERKCVTQWGMDPRKEKGELLWPERFPKEEVDDLKRRMGAREYAAQYQQRPSPLEGYIFEKRWFDKTVEKEPAGCRYIQSWDMRFMADGSKGDYVVGQLWARKGMSYYLVDQVRGKWSFVETCRELEAFVLRSPRLHKVVVEKKANGEAVVNMLAHRVKNLELVTPMGGKSSRAHAVAPLFEEDRVHFLRRPWWQEYRDEMCSFPVGRHDDQVDATTQALLYFEGNVHISRMYEALKDYV